MTENRTLGETSIKSTRQKRRNDSHSQVTTNTQEAVNMMSLGNSSWACPSVCNGEGGPVGKGKSIGLR